MINGERDLDQRFKRVADFINRKKLPIGLAIVTAAIGYAGIIVTIGRDINSIRCEDVDLNGNGRVDIADFSLFRMHYHQGGLSPLTGVKADFDRNGIVNYRDFEILKSNFGRVCSNPDSVKDVV